MQVLVQNKAPPTNRDCMVEASLLPQKEGKKLFLGHSRVFLLDFLFQDLGILSRIS